MRKLSLVQRLALIYALSSTLLLTCLLSLTFWLLEREFEREETRVLDDTVNLFQTLVDREPDWLGTLRRELPADLRALHFHPYQLQVRHRSGQVLFETPAFPKLGSEFLLALPESAPGAAGEGRPMESNGASYLVVRTRLQCDPQVSMLVTLETTLHRRTLGQYGLTLAGLALASVAVVAASALALARRGLAPLDDMAALVQELGLPNLRLRLRGRPWPSELQPLAREFDRLLDEVEEGIQQLSHFSTELAHELRTPLASLSLQLEVALGNPRTAREYQEVLGSVTEELERLTHLVERLLLLARTDSARPHLDLQWVELHPLLDRLIDFMVEDRSCLQIDIPAGATLWADPVLLELALGNLISNAVKYSQPPWQLRWQAGEREVCLELSDSGPGIEPDLLPHLFERFYRAHPQGLGLGLALVRSALKAHGGEAQVESTLGQGSRFTLTFPSLLHPPCRALSADTTLQAS